MSHKKQKQNAGVIPDKNYRGHRARSPLISIEVWQTLRSWTVGGLPLINRLLDRMQLEEFLAKHLPPDDPRQEVPTTRCLLLLLKNILLSREPPVIEKWRNRRVGRIVCSRSARLAVWRIKAA